MRFNQSNFATILNKFGKGPLDNATYQISIISAKRFLGIRLLNAFLCISMLQTHDPLDGAIFDPGAFI